MTRPDQNDEPPETRPPGSGEPPSGGVPESRPQPPAAHEGEAERTDIAVAVLLAVAAVIVAIVGGRAALVGDSGSDTWQAAIRQDVKRSAGIVEDARFLYSEEVPQALQVEEAGIRGRELRRASRGESGTVRGILEAQSKAQKDRRRCSGWPGLSGFVLSGRSSPVVSMAGVNRGASAPSRPPRMRSIAGKTA